MLMFVYYITKSLSIDYRPGVENERLQSHTTGLPIHEKALSTIVASL